jgi:hypothetical protein
MRAVMVMIVVVMWPSRVVGIVAAFRDGIHNAAAAGNKHTKAADEQEDTC